MTGRPPASGGRPCDPPARAAKRHRPDLAARLRWLTLDSAEIEAVMEPTFFETPADFRAWLAKNHATAALLLVGFYKKGTGRPSITWPESVDEALCYGWIDGVRKGLDAESYTIRFTPRSAAASGAR